MYNVLPNTLNNLKLFFFNVRLISLLYPQFMVNGPNQILNLYSKVTSHLIVFSRYNDIAIFYFQYNK